jgi:hypothetical protein
MSPGGTRDLLAAKRDSNLRKACKNSPLKLSAEFGLVARKGLLREIPQKVQKFALHRYVTSGEVGHGGDARSANAKP